LDEPNYFFHSAINRIEFRTALVVELAVKLVISLTPFVHFSMFPFMKDPYQSLGLSRQATQDEIKNAYRSLAKKYHPDLNPGNKEAEKKFKDVAGAYELIGTPEMRAKFDQGETSEQMQQQQQYEQARSRQSRSGGPSYYNTQQNGGRYSQFFGEGAGMDDIFESLFRQGRGGPSSRQRGKISGEDQLYHMEVDFKDSILGADREITLPHGKKLQIKIPPGINSGKRLRFRGQGGPGAGGAPPGDAYIEITVKPLTGFTRVGNNVESELPISFIEGILGAEVQVPTLEGSVLLKIPPGVSTGSRLRIRGKGVASANKADASPGDQIVILKVVLPKQVDPELQATLRAWGGKYSYNPRGEI
jgi:DnaJ-class molecular chaperone